MTLKEHRKYVIDTLKEKDPEMIAIINKMSHEQLRGHLSSEIWMRQIRSPEGKRLMRRVSKRK